jgi:glucosamine-6-phosphate deaminase
MSTHVSPKDLYRWCSIPVEKLVGHPELRVPFRLVHDAEELGQLMANEFVRLIQENNRLNRVTRAIVPCGPKCWYEPFTDLVNSQNVSLENLVVFHMDECLDWQGRPLPAKHPFNFRSFMEEHFYGGIRSELAVPQSNRFWLLPSNIDQVKRAISEAPVDVTIGGWGQDGHVAYNQARRDPFNQLTLEDLANSTIRIQDNNIDTVIALSHRTFGGAYQFAPTMSVTLGMRECLAASKVRLYSDTGAWKQTALRVALFSEPTPEYPITLLQRHPDAMITATMETARHPIAENPDWELF